LKAKIRTGGVTAEAFPPSENIVRFIHECVNANVPFKATAGLHHPIRANYNLTYEPDSERGKMYGYLNMLLAAAFVKNGMSLENAKKVMEEENAAMFVFGDDGVQWWSFSLTTEQVCEARQRTVLAFGSCSFHEPIDDLKSLKFL
jgi:hypothetical protein